MKAWEITVKHGFTHEWRELGGQGGTDGEKQDECHPGEKVRRGDRMLTRWGWTVGPSVVVHPKLNWGETGRSLRKQTSFTETSESKGAHRQETCWLLLLHPPGSRPHQKVV